MPNDPRVKFKKRIYDSSRNIMYFSTGGDGSGAGTGDSGGGGGGGGGIPWTPVGPSIPDKPPPHVNPSNPDNFPTYFRPTIVPFDPYQRALNARAYEARARILADENERLRVKPIVKPQVMDRPKSGVLDDMLPIDDEAGTIPKDTTGPFKPAKNQFGLKFKINPIDQSAPKIEKTINTDSQGTMQDKVDNFEKKIKAQNKLISDLDALSGDSIAIRVYEMQAAGKSQGYIDNVVKIIKDRQASKAANPPNLTQEQHLELMESELKNPTNSAYEIATLKKNITMLKNQQAAELNTKAAKLQSRIDDAYRDLAKPNTPAQEKYLKTIKTKAENEMRKITQQVMDKTNIELGNIPKPAPAQPAPAPSAASPALGQGLEAQKLELEGKILTIIDKVSKSKNIKQNAQLTRQRKQYEQRLAVIENNLKMRDTAMQNIQKTQKIIDNAAQFKQDMDNLKFIEKALKDGKITDGFGTKALTADDKISLNKTKDAINMRLKANQAQGARTAVPKPDNTQSPAPRVEATEAEAAGVGFDITQPSGREQADLARGYLDNAPTRSADSIRIEQRLAAIRNNGAGGSADYLDLPSQRPPSQRPPQSEEGEMREMGSLAAKNHIAEFDNLVDTLVESAKDSGFKVPEAPESIQAEGELAVKKYVYEQALEFAEANNVFLSEYVVERGVLKPTGKPKTKTAQLKVLDEFYQRAVVQQASQPARLAQASSSSVKPPAGTPPASAPPSAPATPAEFAPEGGLVEGTGAPRVGTTARPTQPNPADVMARLNERFGGQSDSILDTLDTINSRFAGDRPSARPEGGKTPSYSPNPSQRLTQRRQGEIEPMEMDSVPLIDKTGKPAARGRGRAKAPTSGVEATAPKPKLNFGITDLTIQGQRNINVASEFTNSVAGKFGSSLKTLGSRVPTLKAPSINTIKRVGVEGATMGTGIIVGIGVSYLMAQYFKAHPATDIYSQIGQQYAVGFVGAAAGNIVMRALSVAGKLGAKKVFTTAGGLRILAMETAAATGEAAVFVALQLGVELGTEALMDRYGFSHTASKTTAAVAGGIVGIGVGAKQGGPYGAVLMAAFAAFSITTAYFEGQEEDREEAETRRTTAENTNKVNSARMQLVRNLKLVDNDYDKAYHMLSQRQQDNINLVGATNALNFRNSLMVEFNPLEKERNGNPYAAQEPEVNELEKGFFDFIEGVAPFSPAAALLNMKEKSFQEQEAREQAAKDKYYEAYINWYINKKGEVLSSPPPEEDEGFRLLERDTLGSWRTSAEFSAELVYEQTQNYNKIVNNARNQVLDEWHNNMTTLDELKYRDQVGRDLVETAGLDTSFYTDYEKWVVQDATTQLAVQFNHFGINYRDADQKLVAVAGRDPSVLPALDHYYEVMTQLSKETGLPVAELARLDALPEKEQERELGKINAIREKVIREGLLSDKAAIDAFNAGLIRDMQSYGDNFEAIMRNINDQQMLMGYSYLYGTNKTDFYRQLHLEAPVIKIENPYAGSTEFDYEKNRTPGDTLIYGYRYNLTDSQNQELEEYLYNKNRELYQKGDTKGRLTTEDAMAKAAEIYTRDIGIYRKSDAEVAKDNNMTLDEFYEEYGYATDKKPPVIPIEWKDITERDPPPPASSNANIESDDRAGERQANATMQQARIEAGGTADEFDRMAAGAYDASQRALVDAQGGNNIEGNQPRTNANGETIRAENDPDGP